MHGNHHQRVLLTEVQIPWFYNLRFFTSSMVLYGADVSGVWTDLWHHLTLRRGTITDMHSLIPHWRESPVIGSHDLIQPSFLLRKESPLLQALQRILSSFFCEKKGRGDYCWVIEGKWSEQSRWDSHLLWEESLEAILPRPWELIELRTPDWAEMVVVCQQ